MNNKRVRFVESLKKWSFITAIGLFVSGALHPVIYFILSFVINLQGNGRNGQDFLIKGTIFCVVLGCVWVSIYLICKFYLKTYNNKR